MTAIRKIAIVGASGNLCQALLPVLTKANFHVTAICRPSSAAAFPDNVEVEKTEYTLDSLTRSLKGKDAVICVLDATALKEEALVIDAAAQAGVKWFVPSEFGHNTADERVLSTLPLLKGKAGIIAQLESKKASGMKWVGLVTGLFFDWCMAQNMLSFDIGKKTAVIWDDGETKFHTTNIGDIGTALVNLFSNSEILSQVENTYVYISSFETTQNQILAELERATGTTFEVQRVRSEDMKTRALTALAGGDWSSIGALLHYLAWGEAKLGHYGELADQGDRLLLAQREGLSATVDRIVASVEGFKTAL
ncbi:hypothetical protein F5X68DRAFT_246664 [Plectosphaerella plurivora]|uniref:NmrA-like domain-containing protein n=1 Tax=Plectosphaerella plurivora TaxID=936078 RepID=A0A9P8V500_9PEZI|nr:hypothetical protein F5X68DRAFT_246664 [Plectosphaerella plurivora]